MRTLPLILASVLASACAGPGDLPDGTDPGRADTDGDGQSDGVDPGRWASSHGLSTLPSLAGGSLGDEWDKDGNIPTVIQIDQSGVIVSMDEGDTDLAPGGDRSRGAGLVAGRRPRAARSPAGLPRSDDPAVAHEWRSRRVGRIVLPGAAQRRLARRNRLLSTISNRLVILRHASVLSTKARTGSLTAPLQGRGRSSCGRSAGG
jgi:hypothetical protein